MSDDVANPARGSGLGERAAPRNPLVALLLSVCPGLGQQYAGHLARGIACYVLLVVLSWLAAVAFMFVDSRIGMVFLAVPFVGAALIAVDAWLCASRQPQDYRPKWFNRPLIYAAVFLLLLVTVNPLMDLLIGSHVVRAFPVTSSSMAPTLLKNDLLVINKLAKPGRGDVVLLDYRGEGVNSRLSDVIDVELFKRVISSLFGGEESSYRDGQLVRRVVAVAGDSIEIRDNVVILNGEPLEEPYILPYLPAAPGNGGEEAPVGGSYGPETVPEGHLFVLGDNRNYSIDSRILGPIPAARVAGKVTKVFWSWNFDDNQIHWERTAMPVR